MMSKNQRICKIVLGGLPSQNLRIFPGSYEKPSVFQRIPGLEKNFRISNSVGYQETHSYVESEGGGLKTLFLSNSDL